MNYTNTEINQIVNGNFKGVEDIVKNIIIDSRALTFVDNTLFVAINNVRDGHAYIPELIKKGVKNFLVSENYSAVNEYENVNFIVVADTLKALQQIAAYHRSKFNVPVVGITGSNGKTTIKEWLFQCTNDKYNVVRNPRSYNSQYGVPLSVLLIEKQHQLAIFEAGISKPDEMQNLQTIIKPEYGIFVNIGDAHQENFESLEQKVKEKLQLFKDSKVLVYCKDHELIDKQILNSVNKEKTRLFTWGAKSNADLIVENLTHTDNSSTISYKYNSETFTVTTSLTDEASIENINHIVAFLLCFGYSKEQIISEISKISPIAMRLELKTGNNNCLIINDSYNSDVNSLSIALNFANSQLKKLRKTIILSDIFQSEMDDKELYQYVNKLLSLNKFTRLIGIGQKISDNRFAFDMPEKVFFKTTEDFITFIQNREYFRGELILLKGSRVFRFERISNMLEQRLHRTIMEIDLDAMRKNLNYYRQKLKPETKMMVMVKAFSYGSGSYEVANLLQEQGVDYLAVAFADEGVELRDSNIKMPIVVMNPEPESYNQMIEYKLEPQIFNFRVFQGFVNALKESGLKSYPVHIKLDTGMHRSGFEDYQIDELISFLNENKTEIYLRSVFSHLAAAEDSQMDDFTEEQVKRFRNMSDKIIAHVENPVIRHILNSSGIERFTQHQFEMVRLGIGLYGVGIEENKHKLENVGTLKTIINQIRVVEPTETVGYNRKGVLSRKSVIATLPIGYADGFNRKLGNRNGEVLIHGKRAPIVGNICMDIAMVDITDIPEAKEGDEVIIFNKDLTVSEIAKKIGTIPYEVMTSVSQRVKRIFFR